MKNWIFTAKNYYLFGLSLLLLVVAYVLLGQGPADNPLSRSVAPVMLVVVYCGLIPYSVFCGYGARKNENVNVKK